MIPCSGFAVWAILATANGPIVDERAIQALVESLGAADFREREKANRELTALGDFARPALQKAVEATDNPEIERRLEVLIARIDRDRLALPKRITLRGKYSVEDLLKHVKRQTGYAFSEIANEGKISMVVNWKETTFWDAMDEIATATGFGIQMAGDEANSIGFYQNETYDPHVCRTGPYRLVATNIGTNANRQLSGLPRKGLPLVQYGNANINFTLFSEPKNPMLGVGTPVLTKAIDDTGHSLLPGTDDNARGFSSSYYGGGGQRGHNLYTYAGLAKPSKDATVIKELRGKVAVTLLAGTRPELTIENLKAAKKKTFVSRTTELTVESVGDPDEGGFTVALTAKQLRPNPEDYTWSSAFPQKLEAYDATGRKYLNGGVSAQQQGPGSTSVTVQFASPEGKKLGPPTKLVLVEWLSVQRDVEFAFEGIPLP